MQNDLEPHPLAVVRKIAGLSQKQLAAMIDKSFRTVQSVELGTMRMSTGLANAVSAVTGADWLWLMNGKGPATKIGGGRFTEASYREFRGASVYADFDKSKESYISAVAGKLWQLADALGRAQQGPNPTDALFAVDRLLASLRAGADNQPATQSADFVDPVIKEMTDLSRKRKKATSRTGGK